MEPSSSAYSKTIRFSYIYMLDCHTCRVYSSVPNRHFRLSRVLVLIWLVAAEAGRGFIRLPNKCRIGFSETSFVSVRSQWYRARYLSVSCVDFAHKWLVAAAFSILNA